MRLPDYKLVEQKILFNHYPGPLDTIASAPICKNRWPYVVRNEKEVKFNDKMKILALKF